MSPSCYLYLSLLWILLLVELDSGIVNDRKRFHKIYFHRGVHVLNMPFPPRRAQARPLPGWLDRSAKAPVVAVARLQGSWLESHDDVDLQPLYILLGRC